MNLTSEEIQWINNRINYYDIKFIEIKNEILDHMISAIEDKRSAGDKGSTERLFNVIADEHFGGYQGIEELVKKEHKLYRIRMHKLFWSGYRHYLNWQSALFAIPFLIFSYFLPTNKGVDLSYLIVIFLLSFLPFLYAQVALRGKFKLNKGERSLVKSYLISQVSLPIAFLNVLIYWPRVVMAMDGWKDAYNHQFKSLSPLLLAVILIVFLIANLSCIKLCRQVLKIS